ncbi:MAG: RNA-binding S4 domain-containing protein [Flavobacteriales bacterium]
MSLRWDKYIWSVRLAKTRSQATEELSKGRIRVNNAVIKPSREPKVGDEIQVTKNTAVFSYKVIRLLDKRVGAKLIIDYLIDTTSPEEIEKYRAYQLAQQAYRVHGTGKPSKKDRRELDDFLSDWE